MRWALHRAAWGAAQSAGLQTGFEGERYPSRPPLITSGSRPGSGRKESPEGARHRSPPSPLMPNDEPRIPSFSSHSSSSPACASPSKTGTCRPISIRADALVREPFRGYTSGAVIV